MCHFLNELDKDIFTGRVFFPLLVNFLLLVRSFTCKGTSSAECRMDRPRTFGFNFRGAAIGALAPIGWGLFGEEEIFPFFPKSGDSALS